MVNNIKYSKGINRKADFLIDNNSKKITVKANTKYTSDTDNVVFVVSIESAPGPSGSKFRVYKNIFLNENREANVWGNISTDIFLSEIEKGDILKIYLWNINKAKAYIKDIEIIY